MTNIKHYLSLLCVEIESGGIHYFGKAFKEWGVTVMYKKGEILCVLHATFFTSL